MVHRERLIRELGLLIVECHRPIRGESDPEREAQELARAAVCLVCDRPRSMWSEMTDKLCQLALPELGGFKRER